MNESDRIEAYIRGELRGSELQSFETELTSNPALRKELDEVRTSIDVIEAHAFHLMKDELSGYLAARKRRKYVTIFLVIAGALISMMTLMLIFGKDLNGLKSPDALYAQHMKEYQMLGVSRGVGQSVLFDVQSAYLEKDYSSVIGLTSQVDSLDVNLLMVRAVSQMNIGAWEEALATFQMAQEIAPLSYQNTLLYYQGLTFLKLKDIDNAKRNFLAIAGTNSSYSKDAKSLLEHL